MTVSKMKIHSKMVTTDGKGPENAFEMIPQWWRTKERCLRYDSRSEETIVNGGGGCEDESGVGSKSGCYNIQGIVKHIQNDAWTMGNHGELMEILHLHCGGV